jgi:hypothetical protein
LRALDLSLCDNFDIENRVTAATQSMGALKNVWNSPHYLEQIPVISSNSDESIPVGMRDMVDAEISL